MSNTSIVAMPNVHCFSSSPNYFYDFVKSIPILTAEEEYELFEDYRVKECLEAAHKLVLHNLRYVHFITRKYDGYSLPYSDIVQEGIIGLMKSIKAFDHKVGVRLMSYSTHFIEGEVKVYIMANYNMVKIPSTKSCKKLFFNLRKNLSQTYQISNSEVHDLSLKLGVSEAEIHDFAIRLSGGCDLSIESPQSNGSSSDDVDSYNMYDFLSTGETLEDHLIECEQSLMLDYVREAMDNLSDREKNIINDRFLAEDKKTLQQLSNEYGVSMERVRQIEINAIKKIKSVLQTSGVV